MFRLGNCARSVDRPRRGKPATYRVRTARQPPHLELKNGEKPGADLEFGVPSPSGLPALPSLTDKPGFSSFPRHPTGFRLFIDLFSPLFRQAALNESRKYGSAASANVTKRQAAVEASRQRSRRRQQETGAPPRLADFLLRFQMVPRRPPARRALAGRARPFPQPRRPARMGQATHRRADARTRPGWNSAGCACAGIAASSPKTCNSSTNSLPGHASS